jgi:FO synthase subunit 2
MTFDSVLKNIDPIITSVLDRALSNKEISVDQATELLDADGTEMNVIVIVADELRRRTVGEDVTYVINRNINFTNVCIKRCGFCAFSRDFRGKEFSTSCRIIHYNQR